MSKFKIGDTVWAARFHNNYPVTVPCSVCAGTGKVTLILGNGDKVELACDYCGKRNYDIPTGYETEYQPMSEPKAITIDGIEIQVTSEGEKVEYLVGSGDCHHIYHDENVFAEYQDALKRGEQLKQEWLDAEQKRTDWMKANVKKSFAWNAGYHLREAKQLRRQIEYHEKRAKLCQAKKRGGSDGM